MTITREEVIRKLSKKSGYQIQHIREVLHCMDDVVFEELCGVTPDEEVAIQIVQGVKLECIPVAARMGKNPASQEDIECSATCKVKARISRDMKEKLQAHYESTYNKNG